MRNEWLKRWKPCTCKKLRAERVQKVEWFKMDKKTKTKKERRRQARRRDYFFSGAVENACVCMYV